MVKLMVLNRLICASCLRYSLKAFERLLPSLTMNAIIAVHDTGLHVPEPHGAGEWQAPRGVTATSPNESGLIIMDFGSVTKEKEIEIILMFCLRVLSPNATCM